MFRCTLNPPENRQPAVLQVSGEATIQNIQQFKESLVEGLKAHPELIVDCGEVTEADISCLQLLCSAHRTCQTMKLSPGLSSAIQELIEPSGFLRLEGCCLVEHKPSCIWVRTTPVA